MAVRDDLDWLDKNRLTDNDEFIDVPVPQNQEEVDEVIQTIPAKCRNFLNKSWMSSCLRFRADRGSRKDLSGASPATVRGADCRGPCAVGCR